MGNEKQDETFRVIDRRLFNEAGELRQDVLEQEAAAEKVAAQKTAQPPEQSAAPATIPAVPAATPASTSTTTPPAKEAVPQPANALRASRSFQMLIDLLYSNAAVYLGAYADPATGRAVVDLDSARNIIDMLEILRERTRGNVAPEEDRMLTEVLSSLKMAFLEVSKAAAQAMREREGQPANPTSKMRNKP